MEADDPRVAPLFLPGGERYDLGVRYPALMVMLAACGGGAPAVPPTVDRKPEQAQPPRHQAPKPPSLKPQAPKPQDPARPPPTSGSHAPVVTAIRYGHGPYPAPLVKRGQAPGDLPFCWMFYLLELDGRRILVDTGVGDRRAVSTYRIEGYLPPEEAVRRAGHEPDAIDAIVLTHAHDDHAGGVDRFPRAIVHLQRAAFLQLRYRALAPAVQAGRVVVHDGDASPWPGVDLLATRGHTPGSQAMRLRRGDQAIVFTGDECYFEEDCAVGRLLPVASTVDRTRHRAFVERAARWAEQGALLLTMHDPAPSWAAQRCAEAPVAEPVVTPATGGHPDP